LLRSGRQSIAGDEAKAPRKVSPRPGWSDGPLCSGWDHEVQIKTLSFLPDRQGEGGGRACDRQAGQRRAHPVGDYMVLIGLEGPAGASQPGRILKDVRQGAVVIGLESPCALSSDRLAQLPLYSPIVSTRVAPSPTSLLDRGAERNGLQKNTCDETRDKGRHLELSQLRGELLCLGSAIDETQPFFPSVESSDDKGCVL
jgi:hypothetical protein